MNIDPSKIFFPPVLAVIVIALGYSWSRGVRRGKPPISFQKRMTWLGAEEIWGRRNLGIGGTFTPDIS
jgi:hypothetical protein